MMQTVKIPKDRVGVLIGKEGETKYQIEKASGTRMRIDSEEGEVFIDHSKAEDPSMALSVVDVVTAVGRGFSAAKAIELLDDDIYLSVLDIRDYVGKKLTHIARMRARVIGSKGRTRMLIEELTGAYVSVQGNTVAVIGDTLQIDIVTRALDMLLSGSEHSAVYKYLEGNRGKLKVDGMGF
jgi:ribosomal RNA assembly protein